MRAILIAMLACLPACAHSGGGNPARPPGLPPRTVAAADSSQLQVPGNVEALWTFEVRPATPEADREVGSFTRQDFIARFGDMRRQACARGLQLVVVPYAAGGVQVPEDILLNGEKLRRMRFFYGRRGWEGFEVPC